MTPVVMVPALILEDLGALTPRVHRLTVALGISGFFWLIFVAVEVMLWLVYRAMVPGLTASLGEVAPEVKAQLRTISVQQRSLQRVILFCVLAAVVFLGLAKPNLPKRYLGLRLTKRAALPSMDESRGFAIRFISSEKFS